MSVQARVLSYSTPKAVLIPRAAVWWEGDQAWCERVRGGRSDKVRISTGQANETNLEVLDGIKPGDAVAVR
jgi:multidrug efflux pump subunit AcrA (membrane-fusion protein)